MGGILVLVLAHVYIDRVWRIPLLLAAGFRRPILFSQASALLPPLVLEDALKVSVIRNEALIRCFLDQKDLLNYIRRMRRKPCQVRLGHGEASAKLTLAAGKCHLQR